MKTIQTTRRQRWTREVAEDHINAWRQSGLSQEEYGKQVGTTGQRISRWHRVLQKPHAKTSRRRQSGRAGFVEVVVAKAADASEHASVALEVVLGNGRCIKVADSFDPDALGRLLKVVEC